MGRIALFLRQLIKRYRKDRTHCRIFVAKIVLWWDMTLICISEPLFNPHKNKHIYVRIHTHKHNTHTWMCVKKPGWFKIIIRYILGVHLKVSSRTYVKEWL